MSNEASEFPLKEDIWKYLRLKSEYRISKSEINSNALKKNGQNKKITSISFLREAYWYP